MRARGENPPNEVKENLVDGSSDSKWLDFSPTSWVELELAQPVKVVRYALTSANDAPDRDPKDWTLQGSTDGQNWATIDTQTGQNFSARFQTKEYAVTSAASYAHYRLEIPANHGGNIIQLAEWQLSDGSTTETPKEMRSAVGSGPKGGYNAKSGVGWTGVKALEYGGQHTADGRAFSTNRVFDVDVDVTPDTQLSYMIYPQFEQGDLRYPSTYAAVDLAFTDGTYLSELGAKDQHGATLSPQGQGAAKTLYTNQWNFKRARIGDVAAGKTIDRILVAYDNPQGPTDFGGWIDDVRIDGHPAARERSHPSDWVVTNRGTNSSGSLSRGNNIPATAVPHGFNFWTPMTNAGSMSWLYEYQKANNADNLPTLQAFAASHEPSPWMGDRQTFQVMPSIATGTPNANRSARALPFRHSNETASPHYYGVTFENGLKTEIAPTDHAALFRFTFPEGAGSTLIFDNVNNSAGLTIDQAAGTISGWSDVRSGLSDGAGRMFVYATFDRPMTASGKLPTGNRPSTGFARFDGRTVNMRIATSFISVEQAKRNLALELAPTDTLESVRDRAQRQWDKALGVIEVEGATENQLTTLYSNLYRLTLYPNSAHENTGTASAPVWKHLNQSTSSNSIPAGTTETAAPENLVVPGKVYVNNGFWDTYRTVWSGYSLFAPQTAGELVDGFVQQYRDGGWIARWSSPGYANLMTGTSSDVSFADAYVKAIQGFNARDAYDAAVRNATVAPPGSATNSDVGRKGMQSSIFLGYTPSNVGEGVSWGLEGDINDFGISNMAAAMAGDKSVSKAQQQRLREESEYFRERATNYVHMFDPRIGFFQGRAADGTWKSSPKDYDPRVWGHDHDYTETDGWNFAFHVPQDGQGLANLYGGREGLAKKLDDFFSTPETAGFPGSYGGVIHEMTEARDVRMGQWGFSNQVSHHIPYMYDYAGQPAKTQARVREALRRLYLGSEIGQGYAGDEDNGETSTWFLFSALGFYPLQVGSDAYAVGSPLFKKATVHLPGDRDLVVSAPNNSARNVYVQGLKINGEAVDKSWFRHQDIAKGGTLEFDMGPEPPNWPTGEAPAPKSTPRGAKVPPPLRDTATADRGTATAGSGDAAALFDDSSASTTTLTGSGRWVQFEYGAYRQPLSFYTLTNGKGAAGDDPSSWVVQGSNDGRTWNQVDARSGETFMWRGQTRPFKLAEPGNYHVYRIVFSGGSAATTLGEVEFLNEENVLGSTLAADVENATASAGETVPVKVTVSNYGDEPASGQITAGKPDGWAVDPASASFGPLNRGDSQTLTFQVKVPAGAQPGRYAIPLTATAGDQTVKVNGSVTVIGNVIEFSPNTPEEQPWLFANNGSQFDGQGRFADNNSSWTYKFDLPEGVNGVTVTMNVGAEYLISASPDGSTWTKVAEEANHVHDRANEATRTFDLNAVRGSGRTLYLRFQDSHTEDGWGAWLSHIRVDSTTG